ncbi:MAG TPA: DUF2062 domain-containing protein, partial [Vicinamibacterales bacterium]|nr:DUF2062 domain-containing protein [Vicinamibacterales bacterium]
SRKMVPMTAPPDGDFVGETQDGRLQRWRRRLMDVLATGDTPRRTAAAFAFGVFLSFSPLLGLQIALGLSTAFLLKLSRVAVFAGLCTNLPWLMVPWYTLTTVTGAALLRARVETDLQAAFGRLLDLPVYRAEFWTGAVDLLAPFFWSFMVGSILGAAIVGAVAYVSVARLLATARLAAARD